MAERHARIWPPFDLPAHTMAHDDAAQRNGDRQVYLQVLVSVSHFGKERDDMKAAERVLRNLKTGLGNQITAVLLCDDGRKLPISETDDRL